MSTNELEATAASARLAFPEAVVYAHPWAIDVEVHFPDGEYLRIPDGMYVQNLGYIPFSVDDCIAWRARKARERVSAQFYELGNFFLGLHTVLQELSWCSTHASVHVERVERVERVRVAAHEYEGAFATKWSPEHEEDHVRVVPTYRANGASYTSSLSFDDATRVVEAARAGAGFRRQETTTRRHLTDDERVAIRANARGNDVYCGTDADAETIARGACDHDAEWDDDAAAEAVKIARDAWEASRG